MRATDRVIQEASEHKSSAKLETSSSSGGTGESDPDSSVESTDDSTSAPEQLIAIKKEGFEKAMQVQHLTISQGGIWTRMCLEQSGLSQTL